MRRAIVIFLALFLVLFIILNYACPANAQLHTSPRGVEFILDEEGYSPVVYLDPVGVPTLCFGLTGPEIRRIRTPASRATCVKAFIRTIRERYEPTVRALFAKGKYLREHFNQHRFDALVSFVYNLGVNSVKKPCIQNFIRICTAIHSGPIRTIVREFNRHDRAGSPLRSLPGLTRRRAAESKMFNTPMAEFEMVPRVEVRLRRSFDALRGVRTARAFIKRERLRIEIRKQADAIARTARAANDWLSFRRLDRWEELNVRLGQELRLI